ncbi:acyltransferase [Akkermansiaceae bacterium]|nr:acyltransferase [Akkermansiaceae bacterium]
MMTKHYRPEIDGLRAISVIGVVLFHLELGFPGGFVGVDVFFVISGYLITGILLRQLGEDRFSLMEFWARRVRRIVPAAMVMVVGGSPDWCISANSGALRFLGSKRNGSCPNGVELLLHSRSRLFRRKIRL